MLLRVRHETIYTYAAPVRFGPHRLMLRPRDSFDLRVIDTALTISPAPSSMRWMHDVYGNSVAVAEIEAEADRLEIVSELVLQRYGSAMPTAPLLWPDHREGVVYSDGETAVLQPFLTCAADDPNGVLGAFLDEFAAGRAGDGHLLTDLASHVQRKLSYSVRYDEGTQHPADTVSWGTGSCRDYAWLFIELARRLGFAARFVTGYIQPAESGGMVSAVGLTHAWAEVFLPGDGWVEFDPTNGLVADHQLIRVAVARVPADASPVAGSFVGGAGVFLGLAVGVMIEPISLEAIRPAA